MEGYELITSDDKRLGHVVAMSGGNAIVEHGHLRKTRHAVPETFLEVHDDESVVRATLSKQLIEESPKIDHDGDVDEEQIAAYYGLSDSSRADDDGALNPGVAAAEQQRSEIMRGIEGGEPYGPAGRQIIPPNAHEGGRDFEER